MLSMEINMYCKQAVGEIIGKVEQNSELETEGTKPKAEDVKFKACLLYTSDAADE